MITLRELKKEFKPYRNQNGFIGFDGGWSQNDCLFHAFYVSILDRLGLLTEDEKTRQRTLYERLVFPNQPGLLRRNQDNSGGQESHDNTKAMLWISHILDMSYAKDFLKYGRANSWVFNNMTPGEFTLSAWLGRFIEMKVQAQYIAGETPSLFGRIYTFLYIFTSAFDKKHVESRTLVYFIAKSIKGKSSFIDWAISFWERKTKKYYPNLMADVWALYGWKTHPYRKYYDNVLDI